MNVDTFGLFLFPAQLYIYTDVLCRQRVQWCIEHFSAMSFNDENHAIKQAHHQTFCHKIPKCFSASRSANKATILLCSEVVIVSNVCEFLNLDIIYQYIQKAAIVAFTLEESNTVLTTDQDPFEICDGIPDNHPIFIEHCTLKKIECIDINNV